MPAILELKKQRSGGSQFEASQGKEFIRPYLENTLDKNWAGGMAQGVRP
jgi:hypothetical protein